MTAQKTKYVRFGIVISVIILAFGYVTVLAIQEGKSFYRTIGELNKDVKTDGDAVYSRRLQISGNVQPGSIRQVGTHADFLIYEQDPKTKEVQTLRVSYKGTEPPPDTFKDNSQALVLGEYGRDGVFHAREIQAKCASKYAPQQGAVASTASTGSTPASSKAY